MWQFCWTVFEPAKCKNQELAPETKLYGWKVCEGRALALGDLGSTKAITVRRRQTKKYERRRFAEAMYIHSLDSVATGGQPEIISGAYNAPK